MCSLPVDDITALQSCLSGGRSDQNHHGKTGEKQEGGRHRPMIPGRDCTRQVGMLAALVTSVVVQRRNLKKFFGLICITSNTS